MNGNAMRVTGISRRCFLGGLAGVGALGALGLAGCSPKAAETKDDGREGAADKDAAAAGWLGSAPEIAETDIVRTEETDLLIIGAGNGGMAAAALAAAKGLDFMVCEVGAEVGKTRHWFAAVGTEPFVSQGAFVDRARVLGEIQRYSSGTADLRLINMFMNESNDMFEFVDPVMQAAGEHVVADEWEMPGGMGATPFYTPCWEHHYVTADGGRGELGRNELFEKFIEERGYGVSFGYELALLDRDEEGPVTGAVFSTKEGYVRVNAKKATLLATGGYSSNAQMLTALSPITVQSVTSLGYNMNNKGQGIKAALWVGAVKDLTSATMIFDRGIVPPGVKAGYLEGSMESGDPQWPTSGQFNPGTQPFLKVNVQGERFCNESADYDYPAHAAAQMPNGTYVSVWDGNFGEDVTRFHTLGCSAATRTAIPSYTDPGGKFDQEIEKGTLQKADTLEELALKLFADDEKAQKTFLETVGRYNELYDKQMDEDFGKEPYRLSSLRTPPFYGAPLGGTLLTTIDGIRINSDCQALDARYEPIEGLYAAGDCSGSIFSGNYPDQLHGFACGRTMTEAMHVVRLVAAM